MTKGLRVTAVDCGPFKTGKGLFITGGEGEVELPTAVYIIEHPKHGVILYDTGVNYRASDPEQADAHFGEGLIPNLGIEMARDDAIDRQLINLGYTLEDVKYVIMSHLHIDHTGGMEHFPNATFVVQKKEIRYAWWADDWTKPVYLLNDLMKTRNFNFLEIEGEVDLFNDGTIRLFPTPGHAIGHQAMLLRLENRGIICLAGDTAHLWEQVTNSVPMPYDWNVEQVMQSYMKLRMIKNSGIPIYLSHDGDDWEEFPKNGEYAD